MSNETDRNEATLDGIAVIGFAGHYPGAADIEQFWANLRDGVESIRFFTDDELLAAGVDPAMLARPEYVRAKGVLDGVEMFDASFFGYTPREAAVMDPQQRLFLECAWEALENAGRSPQQDGVSVGVFAACSINTYLLRNWTSDAFRALDGLELSMSSDKDFLATRVSYKLDLKGPAIVVQTACSSSLSAVCMAAQTLLDYQCDVALAGGVSVNNPRVSGYLYRQGAIMSPDGHCRAFDAAAAGTISGEGVGIVVLKRLAEAIADRDTIHAVIKGFALNNDGSNKIGYTAPSVGGQAEVIGMALAFAGLQADDISYVEAHGTGTDLGDPIEIAALTQAFRASTDRKRFCGIGSVKTNLGHTDAAAGVTGFIKASLALAHDQIPPSLHFEKPNPHIDFENSPFYVVNRLTPWPRTEVPRRAGVSAFGIGGTNAHVVLEEPPLPVAGGPSRAAQLLVLSARSEAALAAAQSRLSAHVAAHPQQPLADVAYTLQVGRRDFDWRGYVVSTPADDSRAPLARPQPGRRIAGRDRPMVFTFSGQGAQYPQMGAGLYRDEPVYREVMDECFALLQSRAGLDLEPLLYPAVADDAAAHALRDTRIAQPALFATELAMARLWMHWGVEPEAMIGHSIGEYVAAHLAGVMTLGDALELVAHRGRMVAALPAGSMLAVPMAERQLVPLLGPRLSLAAVNSPALCVVSGDTPSVDALEAELRASGLEPVRLHTSHAFHSSMLDPVLDEFGRLLARMRLSAPQRPYISNLTGDWVRAGDATDPRYWVRHLRETVQFSAGVQRLVQDESRVFIEVGPGATLGGLVRQQLSGAASGRVLQSMRAARDSIDDHAHLLDTLGRFWQGGGRVDWNAFSAREQRCRVPLPSYPFERQRYWVEPGSLPTLADQPARKQADMADWFYMPSWRQTVAAGSLAAAAATETTGGRWLVLADESGLGDALAARLVRDGATVAVARIGTRFEQDSASSFRLDPAADADHDSLFATLAAGIGLPDHIVHLWGVTGGGTGTNTGTNTSAATDTRSLLDRCFWSPTCTVRALGRLAVDRPVRLLFVTNGAQAVLPGESPCPEKATLAGPCLVASGEYPQLACSSVDVVLAPIGTEPRSVEPQSIGLQLNEQQLVEQLLAECRGEASRAPVALRGGQRWVRGHEPVRLPAPAERIARVRDGAVVLITGGLGGIGLTLAQELARAVPGVRLVLVGRHKLPESGEWPIWLQTHAESDRTSDRTNAHTRARIRAVQALQSQGAEVMVADADVSDRERMRAVLAQAARRFGAIDGVIHSAGLPAGGIIELKTRAAADAILAPKVQGTLVLDELLGDPERGGQPLAFFVLCSSLTATLGSAGQVDYTAANAFQDAFAQARQARGAGPTLAIQWDSWRESGMAFEADLPPALAELRLQALSTGIGNAEGAEVFRRALGCSLPQVLVSTRDLARRLAPLRPEASPTSSAASAAALAPTPAAGHARRTLSAEYLAPRNETERAVAAAWQDLFGIEAMGVHDNFFEADGHSLLAIQIVARLAKDLGVKLPVNAMFESPTIAQIAERIDAAQRQTGHDDQKLAEALAMVEQLSDEEVAQLLGQHEPGNTLLGESSRAL